MVINLDGEESYWYSTRMAASKHVIQLGTGISHGYGTGSLITGSSGNGFGLPNDVKHAGCIWRWKSHWKYGST